MLSTDEAFWNGKLPDLQITVLYLLNSLEIWELSPRLSKNVGSTYRCISGIGSVVGGGEDDDDDDDDDVRRPSPIASAR